MKIAVYSISKNEQAHAGRWAASTSDADACLVCDTGSTDETAAILADHGIRVVSTIHIPFRFDDARNAALSLLPDDIDYCISLDQDEVLPQGWREILEPVLQQSPSRVNHGFASNWLDGSVSRHFHERIHARHGYRWVLPVHEKLVWYEPVKEESIAWAEDLVIQQYPDETKDRSGYLPLLEQAITEPYGKDDWKIAYFLAEEYLRASRYKDARETAIRCLSHTDEVWPDSRTILLEMLNECDRSQDACT